MGEKADPNVIQNLMTEGFLRSAENLFDQKNKENGNLECQKVVQDYFGSLQNLRLKDKHLEMTPVFEHHPGRRKRSSSAVVMVKGIPTWAWRKGKHSHRRSHAVRKRDLLQNRQLDTLASELLRKNMFGNAVLNNKAYGKGGLAGLDAQKGTSEFFTGVETGRDANKEISGMDPGKVRRVVLGLSNNTRDVYKDLSGLSATKDVFKTMSAMEKSRNSLLPGLELSSGLGKSTEGVNAEKEMIKALTGLSEKHSAHRQASGDIRKEDDKEQSGDNTAEGMLRALANAESVKGTSVESDQSSNCNIQANRELVGPDIANGINKAFMSNNIAEGIIKALTKGDPGKGLRRDLSNVYESMDKNRELASFGNVKTPLTGDNAAENMMRMLTGGVQDTKRDSINFNGNNQINRELSALDFSNGFNKPLKGENVAEGILALRSSETGKGTRRDLTSFYNNAQMSVEPRRHDPIKKTKNPFTGDNTSEGVLNSLVSLDNGRGMRRDLTSFVGNSPMNRELAGLDVTKVISKPANSVNGKMSIGGGAAKGIQMDFTGINANFPIKKDIIQGTDLIKGINKPFNDDNTAEGIIRALTGVDMGKGLRRDLMNVNGDLFLNNRELSGIDVAKKNTMLGNNINDYVKFLSVDNGWDGAKREAQAFNKITPHTNEATNMEIAGVDIARGVSSHLTGENSLDLAELSSRAALNRDMSAGVELQRELSRFSSGGNALEGYNMPMSLNKDTKAMGMTKGNSNSGNEMIEFANNVDKGLMKKIEATNGQGCNNFNASRGNYKDFADEMEAAQEMYKILANQEKTRGKEANKGVSRQGKGGGLDLGSMLEELGGQGGGKGWLEGGGRGKAKSEGEPAELGAKYRGKPCIKWLSKRCVQPLPSVHQARWDEVQCRKNRCRPKPSTQQYCSLNEGKTGRVCFPSSHRCIRPTCPCRVTKIGVPPRSTCCELQLPPICTTPGRCCGEDTKAFTPSETEEPVPVEEEEAGLGTSSRPLGKAVPSPRLGKRAAGCGCACGCTCRSGSHRPRSAGGKASCGCSCGCGCAHGQEA